MNEENNKSNQDQKIKPSGCLFIDSMSLKDHIKKDVIREIKRYIWFPITIISIALTFFGLNTWGGIRNISNQIITKATANLEKTVLKIYDEINITVIVEGVVKEKAEELIEGIIRNEIKPLIDEIKQYQKESKNIISDLRVEQEKHSKTVYLSELIIGAQTGDRQAYEKLKEMRNESLVAKRVITQIFEKYNYEAYLVITYKPEVSNKQVVKCLGDNDFVKRKKAVYSISERKLYGQIPTLISMIETEPNLDVLAAIIRELNDILGTDIAILQESDYLEFKSAWFNQKMRLDKQAMNPPN